MVLITDLGVLLFCPAPVDEPRPLVDLLFTFRAFTSFKAASLIEDRNSGFCAAFLRISSSAIPTTARPILLERRVRFFVDVSEIPFLCRRRQAWVQTSFAGFLRWRVIE